MATITTYVRIGAAVALAGGLHLLPVMAQTPSKPAPEKVVATSLQFAVSEGTSGGIDASQALAKYRGLADVMEKAVGRRVVVVFVRSFDELEDGIKRGEYDFVMARPSDYPARGIRDSKYSMVATSLPDGRCYFIVHKDSTLKSLADVRGKQIMMPEKVAYMTKFCSAELRDKGVMVANESVKYAKEQGAIGWSIEQKLMDVGGVASYSKAGKDWKKDGHRILHESIPQPYFPLIAGGRISADKLAKVQTALAALGNTEEGKKVLKTIGINSFNIESSARLLELLKWLER